MQAGDLTYRVAFDAPVPVQNGQGGIVLNWTEESVCAAHFRFLRGGEVVQAARLVGRQPVIVTVHNSKSNRVIGTDWRMRDVRSGLIYNVRALPVASQDRQFLEILVEGGVAA